MTGAFSKKTRATRRTTKNPPAWRKTWLAVAALALTPCASGEDHRLSPPKDLDGYFPWTPPASAEAWQKRAAAVREQTLVSLGVWPMPARTPLNAVVHGPVEREDYTVSRVIFESMPGFYVTGSLYRPKDGVGAAGADGKRAAVLCPHGHWPDGRFMHASDAEVKREIASGAESREEAARSPLQARCVQLARMGCVVFFYDMLGYADSVQIGMEVAHGFKKQRPEMNAAENWGLFSPQAEGWNQSIMGLQAWNSIRALDFLESLPGVDARRIGVTGASGGGTQTFILGAIDERPAAAFPAVMVSTAMQGGCTCENGSGLRVGTGNVELAALFAPKPLGLTAADDWTKEMETKGFPQLREHWTRLGVPGHVALTARLEFGHNYNAPSRAAMYGWFNQHLGLGLPPEALAEKEFRLLAREEATVWTAEHPAPAGEAVGAPFERRLLRQWKEDAEKQLAAQPELAAPGWRVALGRTLEQIGDEFAFSIVSARKISDGAYTEVSGEITVTAFGEKIAATFLYPEGWNGEVVVWLDGKEEASPEILAEVKAKRAVALSRLFAPEVTANPLVQNPREAPSYTYGYNHSLFARRVHDALALAQFCRTHEKYPAKNVRLVGRGSAAPVATAAVFLAGKALDGADVEKTDFRFAQVRDYRDAAFLLGALRYGDMPVLRRLAGLEP